MDATRTACNAALGYRPVTPRHVCSNATCAFWEHRPTQAYVCREHRVVHLCGEACACWEQTVAHRVCRLTGRVVGGGHDIHQECRRPENTYVKTTHSVRRTVNIEVARRARLRMVIVATVHKLLAGVKRRNEYAGNLVRLGLAARRRARRQPVRFAELHGWLHSRVLVGGHNVPAVPTDPRLDALGNTIAQYMVKFSCVSSVKAAMAFTAACLERLRRGEQIGGIVVFPKNTFVAAHAPDELAHSRLLDISCRSVAQMTRHIVDQTRSRSGIPVRHMQFPTTLITDGSQHPTGPLQ